MALTNTFIMEHKQMATFITTDIWDGPRQNAQTNSSATPEKPRRTRKVHNKVRTGCMTCKIRRKKCDETKPACVRCTSTGRKCDGYAHLETLKQPSVVAKPKSQQSPVVASPDDAAVFVRDFEKKILALSDAIKRSHNATYEVPQILELEDTVNEDEVEDFILSYNATTTTTTTTTESPLSPPSPTTPSSSCTGSARTRRSTPSKYRLTPILPRAPNFFSPSSPITDLEAHCFSYFRYHTGPQFASYFDSSIWRNYTIKGALAHPLLFTVAAALGAAHRRFGYGISREAFEYCGHAARLHAKAVQGLEELKRQNVNRGLIGSNSAGGGGGMGVYDRDVIMVAEMLLGLFEGFQANYDSAVGHMNNGLRYLLDRPMTLCHSESRYCAIESKPNTFCQLFHRLHCRALQLFGSPTKILVKWSEGAMLPPIPPVFSSLEEARDYVFTEVDWIMHAPAKGWQDMVQRHDAQHLHVNRLLRWSVAYAEMVVGMERTPTQKRACMLMKLCRNATYLLLYLTLFIAVDSTLPRLPTINEMMDDDDDQDSGLAYATKALWDEVARREELNINLGRVKVLADGLMEEHGIFNYDEHSASFDTSIGPPESRDNMPDSTKKTRHLVQRLMRKNPDNDESLWEMLGVYGVAERISALEEHAVIDAVRSIIPEHVDPKWIDITCLMESRKILLRYCRPDEHGLGIMWQQEWWAF